MPAQTIQISNGQSTSRDEFHGPKGMIIDVISAQWLFARLQLSAIKESADLVTPGLPSYPFFDGGIHLDRSEPETDVLWMRSDPESTRISFGCLLSELTAY